MINHEMPKDWRDFQNQVCQILQECGFICEIEKDIPTVRGNVVIDVYAEEKSTQPTTIYLCECKNWQSSVPKTVVHSLRTVVSDYGANWGLIISSSGFQSGAYEAAKKSNIQLLKWDEFQEMFVERWIVNFMIPRLQEEVEPLNEYTEPMNSRIFRKAEKFDENQDRLFLQLRKKYERLALFGLYLSMSYLWNLGNQINFPLRKSTKTNNIVSIKKLPDNVLDATCYRDLLEAICLTAKEGLLAFDDLFGERA